MRTTLSATLVLAAALAAAAPSVQARDGWSPGAAAAVGVVGGLALGGALAGAAANPYYPGRPVYAPPQPRPVYVEPIDDGPVCFVQRRRYVDEFGDVIYRRVRVCE